MKFKKTGALLLSVLLLTLTMHSVVFADTTLYRYTGGGTNGSSVRLQSGSTFSTKLFAVRKYEGGKYVGDTIYAYCIDIDTTINTSSNYREDLLESVNYFTKENAKNVRAIIYNSYPAKTLNELKAAVSNVSGLTVPQAIAGTQLAIWHYTNGARPSSDNNEDVMRVYNYLIGLPGMIIPDLAEIDAVGPTVVEEGNAWVIDFSYNISDSINNKDGQP
ncbi:MAG: Cys-Gln thioester bond-forming surface protein, partial [Tissierellia bacterium]|nr:Cys-Gln thioester bond-forming surface protein [Tissierellia bacterium]